jgi:ParB-like chromosome segregation protein Spo0J
MSIVRFHEALTPLMEPIGSVSQHPENPNNGDIEAIAASMEVNGVFTPVIAQRSTGYILAGNHRYAALHSLGARNIPVVWLDVDEKEALRILLADNRIAQLAMIDSAQLRDLLERVSDEDLGLLGTGYDDQFLNHLINVQDYQPEPEPEPDEVKQRGQEIKCPSCGHTFGGGR